MSEEVSESSGRPASASALLRVLVEGTAAYTGEEFFRSLARHAARALGARYAFVAENISALESRSLAYWEGLGFGTDFSYRSPGSPCAEVREGQVCVSPSGVQARYPEDTWLAEIGVDSYVGVPMKTAQGAVLGHIAVLHTQALHPSTQDLQVLQVFAARACAELERLQAERALRAAHAELERYRDRLSAENVYLQEELRRTHNVEDIVGCDPGLEALLEQVARVAPSDAAVLIQGETGTGKELIARALHNQSARRERPLVKVNCGAIASGLVESELFGHVKGAFTGAVARRVGRFQLAHGGTIFLDEVGELSADVQVKLLRVLQEHELELLGSSETVRVDVRVIAATNRNLEHEVSAGRFRADLYYRLNVIPLHVPPLRERRGDVPKLALHFMWRAAQKIGRPVHAISSETLQRLCVYPWPGNIRELQNVIERAVILSPGPTLELDARQLASTALPTAADGGEAESTSLEDVERRHVRAILERSEWVIEGSAGAAKLLGLNASTTRSLMKRLGITRPDKP